MSTEVARPKRDVYLAVMWLVTAVLGAFFVLDAVYPRAISSGTMLVQIRQQIVYLVLAVAAYLLGSRLSARWLYGVALALFMLSLIGCVVVLVPGIGREVNGASRWLSLPGGFTVQPSEYFKLGVVLVMAWLLERLPRRHRRAQQEQKDAARILRYTVIGIIVVTAVLIERQPDLGTAAVVMVVLLSMMWLGGVRWTTIAGSIGLAALVAIVMVQMQPYRLQRILHHNQRWDPVVSQAEGFQPVHAELGIGMGGVTGQGIGMGITKYLLPAATTDYVFVTIAEETGLLGSLIVVGILAGIVGRLFWLSARAPTRFAALAASGLGCWIGTQSVMNLLMVTGIVPPVGVPLPFFSMGGSSLTALAFGLGIVQAAMLTERKEESQDATRDLRRRDGGTRVPGPAYRVRCGFSRM